MTGIQHTTRSTIIVSIGSYGEHIAWRICREKNAEGLDRNLTDRMCRMLKMETGDVGTWLRDGAMMNDANGGLENERHAETFRFYSKARA